MSLETCSIAYQVVGRGEPLLMLVLDSHGLPAVLVMVAGIVAALVVVKVALGVLIGARVGVGVGVEVAVAILHRLAGSMQGWISG